MTTQIIEIYYCYRCRVFYHCYDNEIQHLHICPNCGRTVARQESISIDEKELEFAGGYF